MSWKSGLDRRSAVMCRDAFAVFSLTAASCTTSPPQIIRPQAPPLSCTELRRQHDEVFSEYVKMSKFCLEAINQSIECHSAQSGFGALISSCSSKDENRDLFCKIESVYSQVLQTNREWFVINFKALGCSANSP
jgi:hypothetical protein